MGKQNAVKIVHYVKEHWVKVENQVFLRHKEAYKNKFSVFFYFG